MKYLARALAIVISLAIFATASMAGTSYPSLDPVGGTPPSKDVKNWMKLSIIGDSNAPFPILWISPKAFNRSGLERVVVLPRAEYSSSVVYARSYPCSSSAANYSDWGTLLATEYSAGKSQDLCILPRAQACVFLSKVSTLPDVSWTEEKAKPIRDLASSIGCYRR